jgi:hypothetical protein
MPPILHTVLIDETVEPRPDAIEHLLAALDTHPEAIAVGGHVILADGTTESCGGDFAMKDGLITFTPFVEAEARSCRWLPPAFVAIRHGAAVEQEWLFDGAFRAVPEAVAMRRRDPAPPSLPSLASFYQRHKLVPKDVFQIAPELTGMPAARLLLELADARGAAWIAEQWAGGGLAPLFRKQRKRPLAWWERRPAK